MFIVSRLSAGMLHTAEAETGYSQQKYKHATLNRSINMLITTEV